MSYCNHRRAIKPANKRKNMKEKYQVIGSVGQWAAVDFGLSINKAKACLKPAKFSNGLPALCWMWGFTNRVDAERFVARCNSALAFQSGRIDRWITPTFVVVETETLKIR